MHPIRPIPINASHRVQSITPMPQVRRTNTFRPMSQSPPPFETPNQHSRLSQLEDIFGSVQMTPQPGNIALLARGISLLSITQLRELLRDYSLPTGGNKHILVNRLIIFLETFGQNQQNLMIQFSAKLKALLSVENEENAVQLPQDDIPVQPQLPNDVLQRILSTPPSCLFEPADDGQQPVFGPIIIQPNGVSPQHSFNLSGQTAPNSNSSSQSQNPIPILQFVPYSPDAIVSKLTVQIGGMFVTLRDNILWADVSDFLTRTGVLQVITIEPPVPLVALIRWMRRVPILTLVQKIITDREPALEPLVIPNPPPDGVCPLTRKLIARPSRGYRCAHAECFDLTGFLCYASKNNAWQCPICHNKLNAEDLRSDPNYFKIAQPKE